MRAPDLLQRPLGQLQTEVWNGGFRASGCLMASVELNASREPRRVRTKSCELFRWDPDAFRSMRSELLGIDALEANVQGSGTDPGLG